MARSTFGGGASDYVASLYTYGSAQLEKRVPNATVTLYTDDPANGGTQVTDLLVNGAAATSVQADASGNIGEFQGPDGLVELWASADGGATGRFLYAAPTTFVQVKNERLSLMDPRLGSADPTGGTPIDTVLQTAADYLRDTSNPTLFIPPGEWKLSRNPNTSQSVNIWEGVIEGAGDSSHIFMDPAASNSGPYYLLRVAAVDTASSGPITFRRLRITANNAAIGGAAISAIHGDSSTAAHSDNVTVDDCTFEDVHIAFGCTKAGASVSDPANRFQNWRFVNSRVNTSGNKAVELGDCVGGWIENNDFVNVWDGPQAIFNCDKMWFLRNRVQYKSTGINIAQGVTDFWVLDNTVESATDFGSGVALYLRTEATSGTSPVLQRGKIRGNTFINQGTAGTKRTIGFYTNSAVTAATYKQLKFQDNYWNGANIFYDFGAIAKSTFQDISFLRDWFDGWTSTSASQVAKRLRFRECVFPGAFTANGSGFDLEANEFRAGLTFAAGSSGNQSFRDYTNSGTVTNTGTNNTVASTRTYAA